MTHIKVKDLNGKIVENTERFIQEADQIYIDQIKEATKKIIEKHKTKPIVLLSGPSGSGKTTTAYKISDELKKQGYKAHIISMDNYFIPSHDFEGKDVPLDDEGNIDFESPHRLDISLFQSQMEKIINCQKVDIPVFDFINQSYKDSISLEREEDDIVIFEGIHALNPLVTGSLDDYTTCVYVSVRTRIMTSDERILHPEKIRLMRRLIRDKLFRGRSLHDVFKMYKSVMRGEDLYILPFKYKSHIDIDTFLAYEVPVYKKILFDDLKKEKFHKSHEEMLILFDEISTLERDFIPHDSLIKEFIG